MMPYSSQVLMARNKAGLTQQALARKAGMRQHAIARLESPYSGTPTINTLQRIADALKLRLIVRFE